MSMQKAIAVAETKLMRTVKNRFIRLRFLVVKQVIFRNRVQNYCIRLLKLVSMLKKIRKKCIFLHFFRQITIFRCYLTLIIHVHLVHFYHFVVAKKYIDRYH